MAKTRRIYTVSEITQDIRLILESNFAEVWVEGEVSNLRPHASGHIYFSLKDKEAVLNAAIFRWADKNIKFQIKDGLKVICFGRIDLWPPSGQYKLVIEKIEPKGIGGLQLALEQLKERLEKEGIFSVSHKRPIPYLPAKIAIVTSLGGAAIKDMLKVIDRRFSGVEIIIYPVQVQGDSAKTEIPRALKDLNRFNDGLPIQERIEVILLGRGGGSMEDLWAFNEEVVARAIYASGIPVISAVGHERDWTISDLVADLRAPTPSAAAEMVLPRREDLKDKLSNLQLIIKRSFSELNSALKSDVEDSECRLALAISTILKINIKEMETTIKRLLLLNPGSLVKEHILRLTEFKRQLISQARHFLEIKSSGLNTLAEKLSSLSPLNVLARGYSITFKYPENAVLKDLRQIQRGDLIKTKLNNGECISRVTDLIQ